MRTFVSKSLQFGIVLALILIVSTLLAYQEPGSPSSSSVTEIEHPYLITNASVNYVVINGDGFTPGTITLETGESLTWHNATAVTQTIHSGIPPINTDTAVYLPIILSNTSQNQRAVSTELTESNPVNLVNPVQIATLTPGADYTLAFTQTGTFDYYLETAVQFTSQVIVADPGPTGIASTSPINGEGQVSVARESIIQFDHPLDPASVSGSAIYAQFGGQILTATLHLSPDNTKATLFYDQPLPASARVRLTVDGGQLTDDRGNPVDADGDGQPGGTKLIDFDTLGISVIPGTSVCGTVYASELGDDGGGGTVDVPLEGTTITVDGMDTILFTVTDVNGDFCLDPAPAGKFFVHIDGRTATNNVPPGAYYPYVGKAWESIPGNQTSVGVAHLPLVMDGTLQAVSQTADTTIQLPTAVISDHPSFADVAIMVPADSLFANDGTRGGQVGIAPVPPDRLPGTLPAMLNFPLVITVQSDGATNFDVPAPVCFPNLPDPNTGIVLVPGAKSALHSFNHDAGRWEAIGPMTVSDDGTLVCSDPGVGVLAPGWHGAGAGGGGGCDAPFGPSPSSGGGGGGGNGGGSNSNSDGPPPPNPPPDFGPDDPIPWDDNLTIINPLSCLLYAAQDQAGIASQMFTINLALDTTTNLNAVPNGYDITGMDIKPGSNRPYAIDLSGELFLVDPQFGDLYSLGDTGFDQTTALSFRHSDDTLWGWSEDGLIIIDIDDNINNGLVFANTLDIQGLAWANDGSALYASSGRQLWLYDSNGNFTNIASNLPFSTNGLEMRPDGLLMGIATADFGELHVYTYDVNTLQPVEGDNIVSAFTSSETITWPDWCGTPPGPGDVPGFVDPADFVVRQGQYYYVLENLYPNTAAPLRRGRVASNGIIHDNIILAEGTYYRQWVLNAETMWIGWHDFTTPAVSGFNITIPDISLGLDQSPDSDGDGLRDKGEYIVGTNPAVADTDGDGVLDGAEIQNGTNPLDGLPVQTGIIASADTPGTAVDVCTLNDLAIVADSNAGISVFDVSQGQTPTNMGQVDTLGEALRVTCSLDTVAVADGSAGLAIVDISDPPAATIGHQIDLGDDVKAVAATAGIVYAGTADGSVTAVNLQDGAVIDSVNIGEPVLDMQLGRDVLYVYAKADLYTVSLLGGMAIIDNDNSSGTFANNEIRPLRLFVGDEIAYAVHRTGYNTFDLTDPANPVLIANGSTAQFGWRQIVDNGSGLGLATVGPNSTSDGPHHVSLYDVSDPAQTDQFLVEFVTPGLATAVSIYNGLVYAADGDAGLQLINYQAYDTLGVAPAITITTNAVGGSIEEGQTLLFGAQVDDDVQVRNVEFYIDGQRVVTDGNYPFAHRAITPLLSQQSNMLLTAKATDTGGNTAWAADVTLTITPDLTPPQVAAAVPADGASLYNTAAPVTAVSANFNEPIDPATLITDTFQLFAAGVDGIIGTADDTQILSGTLSYQGLLNMALLTFANPLPVDQYQAVISNMVTDIAGNALTTPFSWQFQVTDGAFGNWNLSRSIPFVNPQAAHYNPVNGLIYVGWRGSGNNLYRIETDDSATLIVGANDIAAVAVDPQTGHIFFSEDMGGIIYRSEITGTGRTVWVSGFHSGDDDPVGMAFAPALYTGSVISPGDGLVVDRGSGGADEVWRFSPNVAQGETAVHSDNGTLVDSVDIAIGLNDIYLVDDKDASDGVIYRLDVGGVLTAITTTIPLPAPEGIAIDPLTGNLLIQEVANQQIYSVDPATGVVIDALPGFTFAFPSGSTWAGVDISPDGQQLIISDKGSDIIYVFTRAN